MKIKSLFLFLVFMNFITGILVATYGREFLNFIALECFGKEKFYVYDKDAIFGMYMSYLIEFSFCIIFIYSIFCYWLYNKYRGAKFFLTSFCIFIIYFFIFCLIFNAYKLISFLMHFTPLCLMYVEIIIFYRFKKV